MDTGVNGGGVVANGTNTKTEGIKQYYVGKIEELQVGGNTSIIVWSRKML